MPHLISKVVDYGMDMQDAIDLPRLIPAAQDARCLCRGGTHVFAGDRGSLSRAGTDGRPRFEIVPAEDPDRCAQVIRIDWDHGTLTGASEVPQGWDCPGVLKDEEDVRRERPLGLPATSVTGFP